MKLHDVDQGSDAWRRLRLGRPTASNFHRIITATGRPSSAADKYFDQLMSEWVRGAPDREYESQWMNRGKYLEPEAVAYYELEKDVTTDPGGFATAHNDRVGCSPDRLVYVTGQHDRPIRGLEIKCGMGETHETYRRLGAEGIAREYQQQVQGCMWVLGLQEWDTMSYHPDYINDPEYGPGVIHTIARDPEWANTFSPLIHDFCERLEKEKAARRKAGWVSPLEAPA